MWNTPASLWNSGSCCDVSKTKLIVPFSVFTQEIVPSFAPAAKIVPFGEYLTTFKSFLKVRVCLIWATASFISIPDMRHIFTTPAYITHVANSWKGNRGSKIQTDCVIKSSRLLSARSGTLYGARIFMISKLFIRANRVVLRKNTWPRDEVTAR